jgi:bifunctional non-homologous end joining protein LigD
MSNKAFSEFVAPMMAESTKAPFDSPDWIFEIKLDGYRAVTVFDAAGKPHLVAQRLAIGTEIPGDRQSGI